MPGPICYRTQKCRTINNSEEECLELEQESLANAKASATAVRIWRLRANQRYAIDG